ncbi:hypothetical protein IP87_12750 [beta proteobacterium AAP121]|nr:hypothetical protein IP80_15205 [beta proteobacterium AAP65]KPF97085.1 hypothetical protein IP87_12750 [beta proteobacterium AAP121]
MTANSAHIVVIRSGEIIAGHQLRINGGGAGQSKFFSTGRYGSPEKARQAAEREARALGLPKARPRGGSVQGRVLCTSPTGVAGVRFAWSQNLDGPALRVVASWVDKRGRPRHTSYSVERNGLEGALDKALKARTSCGAPMPDRALLLRQLRREYRTRGEAQAD